MMFSRKRLALVGAVIATVAIAVPVAWSAVTATGTLSHFDKQEHNRLFRDGIGPQDCHGTKANPGIFDDGGAIRSYDKYTFTNKPSTSQKCGHVGPEPAVLQLELPGRLRQRLRPGECPVRHQ